jgi:hypothetical protein
VPIPPIAKLKDDGAVPTKHGVEVGLGVIVGVGVEVMVTVGVGVTQFPETHIYPTLQLFIEH